MDSLTTNILTRDAVFTQMMGVEGFIVTDPTTHTDTASAAVLKVFAGETPLDPQTLPLFWELVELDQASLASDLVALWLALEVDPETGFGALAASHTRLSVLFRAALSLIERN